MTFAAGHGEAPCAVCCCCPCNGGSPAPSFVGSYSCEGGDARALPDGELGTVDPYFDGVDPGAEPSCAAEAARDLIGSVGSPTTEPLEVRLLRDEPPASGDVEDIALYQLELWVR
jgi:hypothetical protein